MMVDTTTHTVGLDVENRLRGHAEIETFEEFDPRVIGDDHLAVGVSNVASKFGASASRVHADDAGSDESGTTDPEQIVGNVLEKNADVWGSSRVECLGQDGGTGRRLTYDFVPGPDLILESVADRRVADARPEKFADGVHGTIRSGSGCRNNDAAFSQQSLRRTGSGR